MKPAKKKLRCWQGQTYEKTLRLKQSVDGPAVDLTGYSARLNVGIGYNVEATALRLTDTSGLTITEEEGQIDIVISSSQTAALAVRSYNYELEIVSPSGRVYPIMYGSLQVKPQVWHD